MSLSNPPQQDGQGSDDTPADGDSVLEPSWADQTISSHFGDFWREHFALWFRIAFVVVRDRSLALDIVQDTSISLLVALHRVERKAWKVYACRSVHNAALKTISGTRYGNDNNFQSAENYDHLSNPENRLLVWQELKFIEPTLREDMNARTLVIMDILDSVGLSLFEEEKAELAVREFANALWSDQTVGQLIDTLYNCCQLHLKQQHQSNLRMRKIRGRSAIRSRSSLEDSPPTASGKDLARGRIETSHRGAALGDVRGDDTSKGRVG